MVTVSVALKDPSLTVRVKTKAVLVVTDGAVKTELDVLTAVSVTEGLPLVCAQS